jgi:demethylmenaquinone methyltransferase / 2-methoxy-6-polyprenyl-1,4-benzoquinol methylase
LVAPDPAPPPLRPHPVLPAYYADARERPAFVRSLFNQTATHYDRINTMLSLGSGGWYRRRTLRQAGLRPGQRVLDVAIGTGLVAREASRIVGDKNSVIGLDLSESMLDEARRSLGIPLIQGLAEQLPVAADSIDFLSMGYAVRHVADLDATFREFLRVLRPGGTVLLLEISRPEGPWHRAVAGLYLGRFIPLLCRWTTAARETETLMRYYWETIERCVAPEIIIQALRDTGFRDVGCHTQFGLFRAYVARKPPPAAAA